MKKLIVIMAAFSGLIACNPASEPSTRLAELKKQYDEIGQEIKTLEAELEKQGDPVSKKMQRVSVTPVATKTFVHYIELQGKVDAEDNITVTPSMPGAVEKINVSVGQNVRKGQVLAEIDNDAAEKNVETLESQAAFARDMFNKQKALWEQKIGTEVQYLSAKNNLETLEKQLAAAREMLETTRLTSPINGQVDAVDIKVGQMASPGMTGIRVVNLANLKVKGEVSEAYSAMVHEGDEVKIVFPDLKKEVDSRISYSARVINQQSRTFTVEAKLVTKEEFKPNMIAVMKIVDYQKKDAVVIGVNLIQKSEAGQFVYVAADENGHKVARRQTISVGKTYGGEAEITSGLKPGDQIITLGYQDLVTGQAIQF